MEAASVAWEPLGWKAVGFSEIEPFPCAILAHRFPTTPNYGSLTNHQKWPIEPGSINLLVGGTPCQSFSVAGLRKGLADPRGNLALVFLGLADRVKPEWIVWENVPGVLSSNGGRDFGSFLGALAQLGYGFAFRVLDAVNFGVPQRRRRVFVVACLGVRGWERSAKVLFESEGLFRDYKKNGEARQTSPADVKGIPNKDFPVNLMFKIRGGVKSNTGKNGGKVGQSAGKGFLGSIEKTFTVATSQDQWIANPIPINTENMSPSSTSWGNTIGEQGSPQFALTKSHCHAVATPFAVRRLTPRECERLQGFPDDWSLIPWKGKPADQCPDGPRYKACGNSMAVPVMRWIGSRIAQVEQLSHPPTK